MQNNKRIYEFKKEVERLNRFWNNELDKEKKRTLEGKRIFGWKKKRKMGEKKESESLEELGENRF